MMNWIQNMDETVLHFIHTQCASSWLDTYVLFLRNPYFWAPVYLFLLVFVIKKSGLKGLWWCAFFFVTFVFCDFISASIIKPFIHRIRPCNNPSLFFSIRELVPCGRGFSFPSSHATNHFGMAIYLISTLGQKSKFVMPLALLWAILVCYAQLYVCVHYPSDILAGAILGSIIGWMIGLYYRKRFGELGLS